MLCLCLERRDREVQWIAIGFAPQPAQAMPLATNSILAVRPGGSPTTVQILPPKINNRVSVPFVTNMTGVSLALLGKRVEWELSNGTTDHDEILLWNGAMRAGTLEPGKCFWLMLPVPTNAVRYRFSFEYVRKGGRIRTAISSVLQPTPERLIPGRLNLWLHRELWHGIVRKNYQSPWILNQPPEPTGGGRSAVRGLRGPAVAGLLRYSVPGGCRSAPPRAT